MNFGDMQAALLRYGFDTGDPIATWLNAALHDFETSADWFCLEEGPYNVLLPAGANTVTLPTDFQKILSVRDTDHLYKLKYYNRHKFMRTVQDQQDIGLLELYTLLGTDSIQFWRVPVTPTNLEIFYQGAVPDMVANSDIPGGPNMTFPTPCHYPIVLNAAAIGLMAENEEQRAQTAQQQYQANLIRLVGKFAGERELDEPETVEDAQGYAPDLPIRGMANW